MAVSHRLIEGFASLSQAGAKKCPYLKANSAPYNLHNGISYRRTTLNSPSLDSLGNQIDQEISFFQHDELFGFRDTSNGKPLSWAETVWARSFSGDWPDCSWKPTMNWRHVKTHGENCCCQSLPRRSAYRCKWYRALWPAFRHRKGPCSTVSNENIWKHPNTFEYH